MVRIGFGLIVVAAVGGGLAWACTPSAQIGVSPSSGCPGSAVTVSGVSFPREGAVVIHFDSPSGPVIGGASGQEFTTGATIPAGATPGAHLIVGVAAGTETSPGGQTSTAFTVGAAECGGAAPGGPGAPPKGGRGGGPAAGNANPVQGSPPAGPGAAVRRRASGREIATGRAPVGGRRKGRSGSRSRAATGPGVVKTKGGQPVFADSIAPDTGAEIGGVLGRAGAGDRRVKGTRSPSTRTALNDLWSGFRSGAKRPSLIDSGGPPTAARSPLDPGVALLALGLLLLATALAVAVARRRRAEASAR